MSKNKKTSKGIALIVASYLAVGAVGGLCGYMIGEDSAITRVNHLKKYDMKDIVATVNGNNIMARELQQRMDIFGELNRGASLSEVQIQKLEDDFIEYMVATEVLYNKAIKDKYKLDEGELESHHESTMSQLTHQLGLDVDTLMRKFNLSETKVHEGLEKELLASKYLTKVTDVSDKVAKEEYDKDPKKYMRLEASHILIAPDNSVKLSDLNDKDKEKLKAEAQDILNKVKKGENFEELAKHHSDDGSATEGGKLGEFGRGDMVKEFEDAVYSLKVDEVTPELVETMYGYHIIKKTKEIDKKFEDVKEDIKKSMIGDKQDALIEKLVKEAKVEYKYGSKAKKR